MKKRMTEAIALMLLAGGIWAWGSYRIARLRLLEPPGRIVTVILPPINRLELVKQRWLRRAMDTFLRRLDILQRDPAGRRIYDSLLDMRPGLVDSLRAVYPDIHLK